MLKEIFGQRHDPGQSPGDLSSSASASTTPGRCGIRSTGKSVLSSDVEIKGTTKFSYDIIIDGSLTFGENSLVKGDIGTKSFVDYGKGDGAITVREQCKLKGNADIIRAVRTGTLSIEGGPTFTGDSQVGKDGVASGFNPSAPKDSARKP